MDSNHLGGEDNEVIKLITQQLKFTLHGSWKFTSYGQHFQIFQSMLILGIFLKRLPKNFEQFQTCHFPLKFTKINEKCGNFTFFPQNSKIYC